LGTLGTIKAVRTTTKCVAASITLVVGATQMGPAPVAQAGPTGAAASPGASSSLGPYGRHCVAQLGVAEPTMRCFALLSAAVAASDRYNVVSIEWTRSNYTGASLTWQGPSPCGDYASSSMPRGWNDTIRSVAQYSGCATTLYRDAGFGGSARAIGVNASVPDLGAFDASLSSQKWCPASGCR
jgi:Peptidase inhibitor family I36